MIEVKHRYVNIKVDVEKIQSAFGAICDDAMGNCAGSARDALYLSYHQCTDTDELRQAQGLLKTLESAQEEGCIQSDEPFDLQAEFDRYYEEWEAEQRPTRDPRNRVSPYMPGDWRKE